MRVDCPGAVRFVASSRQLGGRALEFRRRPMLVEPQAAAVRALLARALQPACIVVESRAGSGAGGGG